MIFPIKTYGSVNNNTSVCFYGKFNDYCFFKKYTLIKNIVVNGGLCLLKCGVTKNALFSVSPNSIFVVYLLLVKSMVNFSGYFLF